MTMSEEWSKVVTMEPEYINHMRFLIELEKKGFTVNLKSTGNAYSPTSVLTELHGINWNALNPEEQRELVVMERNARRLILGEDMKVDKDNEDL